MEKQLLVMLGWVILGLAIFGFVTTYLAVSKSHSDTEDRRGVFIEYLLRLFGLPSSEQANGLERRAAMRIVIVLAILMALFLWLGTSGLIWDVFFPFGDRNLKDQ